MRLILGLVVAVTCIANGSTIYAQELEPSYRGTIVATDAVALGGTLVLAVYTGEPIVFYVGIAAWTLANPMNHVLHGRGGSGAASLGMRLGFVVGAAALTAAFVDNATNDQHNECGGGCGLVSGAVVTIAALPAVTLIDALVFAGPRKRSPVALALLPTPSGYTMQLGGLF